MNLKNLNNDILISNTKNLIKQENRILAKVLAHLHEINSRKLYLKLGYGSLFAFATRELGYSEASAMRRIEAMRFLQKTPEATAMVEKGELNISRLSLLERLSKEAQTSHAQNIEALNLVVQETTTAAESKLREHFKLVKKKRVIIIELDEDDYELWQQTKAELKMPKDAEALRALCQARKQTTPKRQHTQSRQSNTTRLAGTVLKRQLLTRAEHRCEYISPITKLRCENRQYLEADHIQPYFLSGSTTAPNMRILCSLHNRLLYHEMKEQHVV